MGKAPAFQLYASDFDMDTASWDNEEVGIYFRLLMYQWVNGSIPEDTRRLSKIARMGQKRFEKRWRIIHKKFQKISENELINVRMESVRQEQDNYRETQAEAGRRGGLQTQKKRWGDIPKATRGERLKEARIKGTHTNDEWLILLGICGNKCVKCGVLAIDVEGEKLNKDHVKPIALGGDDSISNLQPMCKGCNSAKTSETIDYRPKDWGKCLSERLSKSSSECQTRNQALQSSSSSLEQQTQNPPFLKPDNKHFEHQVGEYFKGIKTKCETILKLPAKKGRPFNPFEWIQEKVNKARHPGAMDETFAAMIDGWEGIDNPYGWANTILATKNGNWIEKDNIIKSKEKWLIIKEKMAEMFKGFEVGSEKSRV